MLTSRVRVRLWQVDSHLRFYVPIIKDSPVYPLVVDANGVVLSLPPIINGDHSKIKLSTTNVLIEVTATDLTKAKIVLNTMVAMFSQYCATKFSYGPSSPSPSPLSCCCCFMEFKTC